MIDDRNDSIVSSMLDDLRQRWRRLALRLVAWTTVRIVNLDLRTFLRPWRLGADGRATVINCRLVMFTACTRQLVFPRPYVLSSPLAQLLALGQLDAIDGLERRRPRSESLEWLAIDRIYIPDLSVD